MKAATKIHSLIIITILFSLTTVQSVLAQAGQKNEPFTFTKVDLELLKQCELLDQRLEKEGLVYTDEALNVYLDQIGKTVLPPGLSPENIKWRFRVLRDPEFNAFALPNGSIYLNSGLLSLMENESQLAGVIGHEVAHALNRHGYKHNRSTRKKIFTINLLSVAGGAGGAAGAVASAVISSVATVSQALLVVSIFGYSRELEKEADLFATKRLFESDSDPKEMINLFNLLHRDYDVENIGYFYIDHPSLEERIAYVNQLIQSNPSKTISPEYLSVSRTRYLSKTEELARHTVQLAIGNRKFRTALAISQRLVDFNPDSSENLLCLAEAYRSLGPRTIEPTGEEFSSKGRKQALDRKAKMTFAEEEAALMSTPIGKTAWKTNQVNAEEQYRKALELDKNNANAYRGLGMLYERLEKNQQAVELYRKYLELRPGALDRTLIQRRVEALEKMSGSSANDPGK
jgi:beta-barrel assembly-enhancing protease